MKKTRPPTQRGRKPSKRFMKSIYSCKGKISRLIVLYNLSLSKCFFGTTAKSISIIIVTGRRPDATRKDACQLS